MSRETGATRRAGEELVALHYTAENVEERLLAALQANGVARESLTAEQLSAVDEFHVGGREATVAIAEQMKLSSGMRLLDVGSGVGGPARYFAAAHQCDVTGVDLTAEFVRAAQSLTERVGLSQHAHFQVGSALDLPFAAASFDGAYLLHVGMNIADKKKLFTEIARVLRPGGILAVYDFMQTGPGEFSLPVPWASSAAESAVASVEEYRLALAGAGFSLSAERSRLEFAIEFLERMRKRAAEAGANSLGPQVLMGADGPVKMRNVLEAMKRGVLAPVEAIART